MNIGSRSIIDQLDNLIFTDPTYIQRAASEIVTYVQALYAIGAGKFGLVGPPQTGCTPIGRAASPTGRCNARANLIAAAIPSRLAVAMGMLQDTNPDIVYSIVNTYNINADIADSPTLYVVSRCSHLKVYGMLRLRVVETGRHCAPRILPYVGTAKGICIGIRFNYPKRFKIGHRSYFQ
ncbi:GDSL esterase/lipase At1g29670 [Linum grandiflorum]